MKKNAPTAKRLASGPKDTKNPNAITRKRMKQRQRFKPSRRGVSAQARDAKRPRVRRKPSRLVLLLIKDQPRLGRRLVMTSIQRAYLRPRPMISPFQQQWFLTSAGPSRHRRHGRTAARVPSCTRERAAHHVERHSLVAPSTPSARM